MSGAWRHRVARDDKGRLHFVFARYDVVDPYQRTGMTGIFNEGADLDAMRRLAADLARACDEPIISSVEKEREPGDDDEDDEGDEDDWR